MVERRSLPDPRKLREEKEKKEMEILFVELDQKVRTDSSPIDMVTMAKSLVVVRMNVSNKYGANISSRYINNYIQTRLGLSALKPETDFYFDFRANLFFKNRNEFNRIVPNGDMYAAVHQDEDDGEGDE